ncbi:MAG: DUF5320 domain-containing protein [Candidatus Marinimicrobia bacterium]|nr:DUF5320 domain-containing protein [Candidatus Neomarinimicrobiota bacterium]
MPRGDRTGPEGYGPMTGRGLGYCAGYNSPGYTKGVPRGGAGYGRGFGRGLGRGFGRGYGYGWRAVPNYPASPVTNPAPTYQSKEQELSDLKNQAEQLQGTLENINKRIQELENEE